MPNIPGWTSAGPMEKVATLLAVPGAPLLFLLIYFLQHREGGWPLVLLSAVDLPRFESWQRSFQGRSTMP